MILLIDNYDSFTFNLYQMCASIYPSIKIVRNDCIDISTISLSQYKGIILSPGPGSPTESGLCLPIVKEFSGQLPILGICLGHQIIAQAFGALVKQADSIMHGKSSRIWHSQRNLFLGVRNPLQVGRYHSLAVSLENFPSIFAIEAHCENHVIMAIRHKMHPTYGLQFHPESYLSEEGNVIIKNFLDTCRCSNSRNNMVYVGR